MTIFDWLDLSVCLAVVGVAIYHWKGTSQYQWAPASIIAAHVGGRIILYNDVEIVLTLSVFYMLFGVAYLASNFLSIYGVMIGVLFCVMSLASWFTWALGLAVDQKQGLGWDYFNFISLSLHTIALLVAVGIMRHDSIVSSSDTGR